jgi:hypothetical protein
LARLILDGDGLAVRLGPWEKLGALHGDVRVPRAAVRGVSASDRPWRTLRGLRIPGTGCPGLIMLGTTRGRGFKDFNAVYRRRPVVVVDLEGGPFTRLVVTVPDATEVAARLRHDLGVGAAGPGEAP